MQYPIAWMVLDSLNSYWEEKRLRRWNPSNSWEKEQVLQRCREEASDLSLEICLRREAINYQNSLKFPLGLKATNPFQMASLNFLILTVIILSLNSGLSLILLNHHVLLPSSPICLIFFKYSPQFFYSYWIMYDEFSSWFRFHFHPENLLSCYAVLSSHF